MIEIRGLTKRYGGVLALDGIDLELNSGEVHAICGENGAGKSTLNKILGGVVRPDGGEVVLEGRPMLLGSVAAAEAAGIALVHQEAAIVPHLSTAENHALMQEPVLAAGIWLDRSRISANARAALARLGEQFEVDCPSLELSPARRQMAALARAVAADCRVLILDEPTASLTLRETEALFAVMRTMRDQGMTLVYVTHRLDEVFALADRVSVLRDGKLVATRDVAATTRDELIRLMVGRSVAYRPRPSLPPGEVALEVRDMTRSGAFEDVSFEVRRGEVVVLSGLIDSGRSEVARALFGLEPYDRGSVHVHGRLAMVPEDRHREGLHLPMSIRDNLVMARRGRLWIDAREEADHAAEQRRLYDIRAAHDEQAVLSLSGGNQQKVLLAKWLADKPDVVVLDEPTRGVDVAAKDQIHGHITELAAGGAAVLVISSDMAEVLALADHVLVMREGRIAGILQRAEASQETILALALPEKGYDTQAGLERRRRAVPREAVVGAGWGLALLGASLANPGFLTAANLLDLLVKVAPVIIVGVAMTLVMLARELDISVGSVMGLCAAAMGVATAPDRLALSPIAGVAVCLGVGLGAGLVHGILVAYGRIPSVIVTLGMLTVWRGFTERLLGGEWIESIPAALRVFGTGAWGGIPNAIWMASVAIVLGLWLLRRTPMGLRLAALGSDPHAAVLRGVPAPRLRLAIFMLSGLAAGIAALFSATQLQVVESGFGAGFELTVIAAVVVGGTSIRGGVGSIWGTVLGALLLGSLSTVLIFMRLGDAAVYWERAVQGALILLAVVGDRWLGRKDR